MENLGLMMTKMDLLMTSTAGIFGIGIKQGVTMIQTLIQTLITLSTKAMAMGHAALGSQQQ